MSGAKAGARIEIIDWDRSQSSHGNDNSSQSVTVEALMKQQAGPGGEEDKLTIDNLWKILSQEKHAGNTC